MRVQMSLPWWLLGQNMVPETEHQLQHLWISDLTKVCSSRCIHYSGRHWSLWGFWVTEERIQLLCSHEEMLTNGNFRSIGSFSHSSRSVRGRRANRFPSILLRCPHIYHIGPLLGKRSASSSREAEERKEDPSFCFKEKSQKCCVHIHWLCQTIKKAENSQFQWRPLQ